MSISAHQGLRFGRHGLVIGQTALDTHRRLVPTTACVERAMSSKGGRDDMQPHKVHLASRIARICWAVVAIVTLASPLFAQTTGQVIGTVVDAQGGVLPGVTVTATSPQLQGTRTATTDATGTFRFPTLPPGAYTIKTTLSGFQDAAQENVTVSLDRSATVNLKMQVAGVSQTVNVMGASPVVDTQSAAGGVTIDQAMMNQLPVARSFYNLARIAPGVTNDNVGSTVLGSSGAENKYIIDGVDSTGIMAGQQKKTMLLDFIDQVNIKTEGTNAEIGGATGGVIEAITKSGSNSF